MSDLSRRETLKMLALAPFGAAFSFNEAEVERARHVQRAAAAARAEGAFEPAFFTAHEFRTVRLLADLVLPADDRSPSASEVGVPEFMDFMMLDRPNLQTPMRGGLAWLDHQARERTGAPFADAAEGDRHAILEAIAWPEAAAPEMSQGVAFFSLFRDLTASGFWTTPEGIEDLQYLGNTFVHEWTGAPPEVLARLGVSYD